MHSTSSTLLACIPRHAYRDADGGCGCRTGCEGRCPLPTAPTASCLCPLPTASSVAAHLTLAAGGRLTRLALDAALNTELEAPGLLEIFSSLMGSMSKAKETFTSPQLAAQVKEIIAHEVTTVENFKVIMRSNGRRYTSVTPQVLDVCPLSTAPTSDAPTASCLPQVAKRPTSRGKEYRSHVANDPNFGS